MAEITVKLCDRCGKPVAASKLPWLIMPYKSGDDSRYPFEDMAWDLCQDCENELEKWRNYAYTAPLDKGYTQTHMSAVKKET